MDTKKPGHITLSEPLDIDGTKVTALQMREPRVKDQRLAQTQADGDALLGEVMLFAILCGIPHQHVENMLMKDYAKLQGEYAGFIN